MAENKKERSNSIGFVLIAAIGGFSLGYLALALIPHDFGSSSFYMIPIVLMSFLISYYLQFILHEAGHLLFGLITGYKFVSFRVGSLTLIKKHEKFQFTQMNLPGTGGQCLMSPPPYKNGNFPYILYNLGGVILNLIVAILSLWLLNGSWPVLINIFLVGFGLAGIFVGLTNGFPRIIRGMPNDGYNIKKMMENEKAKNGFWIQLKMNDALSKGTRPKDLLPENMDLEIQNQEDFMEPLITPVQLMRYNYYLDQMKLQEAKDCLEDLMPYKEELIPLYQNELQLERLFIELIGNNDPEVVHDLYDDALVHHIQITQNWLNRKRVLMAYEIFHHKDQAKAIEYYHQLYDLAKKHPNEGEAKMEMELGDWLQNKILNA